MGSFPVQSAVSENIGAAEMGLNVVIRLWHSMPTMMCRKIEEAQIMARAEQGDKSAHYMATLGV